MRWMVCAAVLCWRVAAAAACGGTGLSLVEVWPPAGDVPANVQTVVTYCGPTAFAEDMRALEAVSFRVVGEGAARATTVRALLGKPTVLDHRVAARAAAELPVGADVEVLAKVSKANCSQDCVAPDPVVVARYHTVAADHVAPTFAGATSADWHVEGDNGDALRITFTLPAASEDARFSVYQAGQAVVELEAAPELISGCGAGFVVRAVDGAGNEDSNGKRVTVDCGGNSSGCDVGPGGRHRGLGALVLLVALVVSRRGWRKTA